MSVPAQRLRTVAGGLCFGEGPRWHEGRLWFSDMHGGQVLAMSPAGALETIVEVPGRPSGIGWLPDGSMLVVSMTDRRVLRLAVGSRTLVEHADLSALAGWHCNDMVVDGAGRAYVGNFGFDIDRRAEPVSTCLVLVEPDGRARVAAEGLEFPNGAVITPDGATLIIGESFGRRLSAFAIDGDGSLSGRRVWAELDGAAPDGICLDTEGAIWIASPLGHQVLRVGEGGGVLDRIDVGERNAYACMLGGPDRRTLYICTARSSNPEKTVQQRAGQIDVVDVDVPGCGWP